MSDSTPTLERDISGETVCGFRVAAYRETHPEHGDKFGHSYSEHWSTPNWKHPDVKVERLFTEEQLRAALDASGNDERASMEGEIGWQPIETAPKEGHLIAWGPPFQRAGEMFWDQGIERWVLPGLIPPPQNQPTHWQPFPEPPAALTSSKTGDER